MTHNIRIGIAGYGNLGRGVESAISQNPDMQLIAVYTRRDPSTLTTATGAPVYSLDTAPDHTSNIDVMILCGGSRSDLPHQGPHLAALFNTVDSFDTHAKIPDYYHAIDKAATPAGKIAIISVGWDPGYFSLARLYAQAALPQGTTYTFWGPGLSQGHSDAIRRIPGVKAAAQYTIPIDTAIDQVRSGTQPHLTTRDKHKRECYVVLQPGANPDHVRTAIITMPDYFADYDTTVTFLTEEQLNRDHTAMPHGGFVIRTGHTGGGNPHTIEYSLKLHSNPQFTSSILTAYARAAHRLAKSGQTGARTVYDIPPGLLSPRSPHELRSQML